VLQRSDFSVFLSRLNVAREERARSKGDKDCEVATKETRISLNCLLLINPVFRQLIDRLDLICSRKNQKRSRVNLVVEKRRGKERKIRNNWNVFVGLRE
jgi:hypothetical protein